MDEVFIQYQMIRRRTLNFVVTMLEESSFSSFASAVKSDDNGVSASEADNGGSGNGITAASSITRCPALERLNHQDQNKIKDSVKTKKRRKKTESQMNRCPILNLRLVKWQSMYLKPALRSMNKNLAITKTRNHHKRKSIS
uniref:Uncharacterized protein n=1 Tax=Setaria viridis TaxID=4556 RepID=A0A4U6VTE2_SETVI|nr:uncharacterized protein LOC117846565 [Setaria viridis]TKW31963.1 hypothetical protein SEVIR_2G140400v2 [Setaria viridis]